MTISSALATLLAATVAAALTAAPATFAAAPPPRAFDLVEQTHRAYQEMTGYSDAGEIAVETRAGEVRFRFETRAGKDGASYLLERLGAQSPDRPEHAAVWTVWRDETGAFLYDGESDTYRPIALREAKTRERGNEAMRMVVRYDPLAPNGVTAAVPWTPPASATVGTATAAGTATDTAIGADDATSPDREPGRVFADRVFTDEIDVRLSTVSVRVIDASGRAIPDLGLADFKVTIGGERAAIQSVDWISPSSDRFTPGELEELARSGVTVPSPGRLIVLFVQTDIHPARAPGHLRLLPELRKLLATFHPEDQVAVVSFDSHLKLRQDFTRDLEIVDDAVWRGIRTGRADEIAPGPFPSLASHFDFEAARRAASPEKALRVVADALLPLPGEKVMIYAGWGLGDYFAGTVTMTPEYDDARESIARARVTVFVLDVTQADYHSLEVGLQTIAEETGGTYEKTFRQPLQMTKRLAGTLEGYYEIGFTVPAAGGGRIDVDLVGRRGEVLQRPSRING